MKKLTFLLSGAFGLALAFASPAQACDGQCDCDKAAHAKADGQVQKVSLEGTIETFGCPMEADKKQCTGAALVVAGEKHMIKKAQKGAELVSKTKDTSKVVKVTGTKQGQFLTVSGYTIKS